MQKKLLGVVLASAGSFIFAVFVFIHPIFLPPPLFAFSIISPPWAQEITWIASFIRTTFAVLGVALIGIILYIIYKFRTGEIEPEIKKQAGTFLVNGLYALIVALLVFAAAQMAVSYYGHYVELNVLSSPMAPYSAE